MVFLIFLFSLFFCQPVFASPDIRITDYSVKTPEWIQLTNNNSENIDITGWYFKDKDGNIKNLEACISANSVEVYSYSGFLNDSGDKLSLYDNKNNLIDYIDGLEIVEKEKPLSTNTCVITPTPTLVPTFTPTSINTPTPDLTIINPESGIILSEFMPYASLEWIEIYNNNDKSVELKNWKIKDSSSNTKTIPDTKISPKSYFIFEFSSFLNNDTDKIILINHNNQTVNQYEYPDDKMTLERSWSFISNSWCQANITQNKINETSCYTPPTPTQKTATPTISPTNTITPTAVPTDKNLYKADALATESAIIDPIEESSFYTTPTITTAPLSSKLVLGETTTVKKNYLPLIFIISGGLLLATPIILDKIKKK